MGVDIFKAHAQLAVEQRDQRTGNVPNELVRNLRAEFVQLGQPEKSEVRAWLAEQVKVFITSLDVASARSYQLIEDAMEVKRLYMDKAPRAGKMTIAEAVVRAVKKMEVGDKITMAEFCKLVDEFRPGTGRGAIHTRVLHLVGHGPMTEPRTDDFTVELDAEGRRCVVRLR